MDLFKDYAKREIGTNSKESETRLLLINSLKLKHSMRLGGVEMWRQPVMKTRPVPQTCNHNRKSSSINTAK